jgi:hypothetical protein
VTRSPTTDQETSSAIAFRYEARHNRDWTLLGEANECLPLETASAPLQKKAVTIASNFADATGNPQPGIPRVSTPSGHGRLSRGWHGLTRLLQPEFRDSIVIALAEAMDARSNDDHRLTLKKYPYSRTDVLTSGGRTKELD